ncbi:MAG: hypothetical protein K8R59_18465 [Thermoanaerobaculales bacterium]|nr:hypothetical protein [Thermoanaerobaculales bacterium]
MKTVLLFIALFFVITPVSAADFPTIKGWNPSGEIMTFTPDTLWEHINGAAETFLQYGFQELKTAELSNDGVTVAVGVYEMSSPLNAFGMYRTELPEDAATVKIGGQALISAPYQALLVKDRFYVKVDVYEGEIDDAGGRAMLEAIAAALPGDAGLPKVFAKLPAEGQVPGSQRFTREAFLGVRELEHCISAEYDTGAGAVTQLFVMLPPEGTTVDTVWQSLASKWKAVSHEPKPVLAKKVPYRGLVGVIRTGENIFGVAGSENEETLLKSLTRFSAGS